MSAVMQLETRALFAGSQGGTVAPAGGNTCAPRSVRLDLSGHREIIMQPAPNLGPLEIIESNFAEGRFVGLLPRQATSGMQ